MDEPRIGHLTTQQVELGWFIPPIGAIACLTEDEADELLARSARAASAFALAFTYVLRNPELLSMFNNVILTAAEMVRAEGEERNDAAVEELRKALDDDEPEAAV